MKLNNKIILSLALLLVTGVVAAWMPVYRNLSLLDMVVNKTETDAGEDSVSEKQEISDLTEIWKEFDLLEQYNNMDSVILHGRIKLYDNLDNAGIREEQSFSYTSDEYNEWFSLENFDRFRIEDTYLLIDHEESEIVVQKASGLDSMAQAIKLLSKDKFREMLQKDGAKAEIIREGRIKKLVFHPGNLDALNQYIITYDATTYNIEKLSLYYTSVPYENYLDPSASEQNKASQPTPAATDQSVTDDDALELDITEYVVEYNFLRKEKTVFNFRNNGFFRLEGDEVNFKGKLNTYQLNQY